jgi:L-alanine-DL-glutamate epimerase-like enolase superfamily enzyme
MDTTVEYVDRHCLKVPFREVPERHMARELPHWKYFEVTEVGLVDGSVGYGETMLFYTWGETTDRDVEYARGRNAADLLWDDSLGSGLQQALFDALGRSLGVPVHELLGEQSHERTPVSWWCIDMPAEDWVSEARTALDRGYTNLKVKGRPWFDIREQVAALDEALPEWFSVDIDFNATLLDASRALGLLEELQQYPQVSHIEGPIPQSDIEGNRRLTEALDVPIALHYGTPGPLTTLSEGVCDGFVVTGGASHLRDVAAVTAMGGRPFWLQLVGTGITAAFSLHCGAVFEQATWPAINCHQLYEHDLLTDRIQVDDGYATVPEDPGLGYDVDTDVLDEFRVEKPDHRPNPPRLIESDWQDGPTIYFAEEEEVNQLLRYAQGEDNVPYFERGVTTRLIPDDGSDTWQTLHEAATDEPVVREESSF